MTKQSETATPSRNRDAPIPTNNDARTASEIVLRKPCQLRQAVPMTVCIKNWLSALPS